jgi:hypothetical protein
MVWTNTVIGEKSLQVHGQAAFKLYLKDTPDGKESIVSDLKEVRGVYAQVCYLTFTNPR